MFPVFVRVKVSELAPSSPLPVVDENAITGGSSSLAIVKFLVTVPSVASSSPTARATVMVNCLFFS